MRRRREEERSLIKDLEIFRLNSLLLLLRRRRGGGGGGSPDSLSRKTGMGL